MGRLTLNMLLSFAQFEREVIGERVRDKIAASKAKGIWVGGPVPIGYAAVDKKVVILPDEAETVRQIFQRYLEVGSIRDLVEDLDKGGIRTKENAQSGGRTRGGIPFGVGGLRHLLRNRFYVGEVAYKGKVHPGEQVPILDRDLFDAVQAKLAASANTRQLKLKGASSVLTGRLYDDSGNRMTPTHTNKNGARYRYYVSHASLQKKNAAAIRISAHEIETLVLGALRGQENGNGEPAGDHELVERLVDRIVVKPTAIEVCLTGTSDGQPEDTVEPRVLTLPWAAPTTTEKGVFSSPASKPAMSEANRDALLTAIAKARRWVNELVEGRVASFAEIAEREGKVERHIRFLAPLAFVSPRLVAAIADGSAQEMKVTDLAKMAAEPLWSKQEPVCPS